MLSESARPLIEATAPIIGERLPSIAPRFYQRMFAAHPELISEGYFSRANQRTGEQPLALAGSVVAFATHLLTHPDSYPEELLSRVAHKHTSLGVVADQYPIVHDHLMAAIAEDLGDAMTPEIAQAWDEVYWLMADALIALEKDLYAQQANDRMFAEYRLASREETGEQAVVLTLEPADDTPMSPAEAGQYVSLKVQLADGVLQPRQFTLLPSGQGQRRVAIQRDQDGEVSPVLCDMQVGQTVQVSNPYGDVTLDATEAPLLLISGGIGVTPMVAFLDQLGASGSQRPVQLHRVDRSAAAAPLLEESRALAARVPNAELTLWTTQAEDGDRAGRLDVSALDVDPSATVYLCGSLEFMKAVRSDLIAAGVPGKQIRYEIFGPDLWMLHDDAKAA